MPRSTLRLVVTSPDHRRVLARPNGLAGWALPVIPVERPFDGWTREALDAARAAVGTTVRPIAALGEGVWAVEPTDRVGAAGTTWIAEPELGRLGNDAGAARAWFQHAHEHREP